MPAIPSYADVILPLPLKGTFTYSLPSSLREQAAVGQRVVVPLGKKKFHTGIIRSLHTSKSGEHEIRDIHSLLDDEPLVSTLQLAFWDWISHYYMCSPGEVFRAALPTGLKLESESRFAPRPGFTHEMDLDEKAWLLLQAIREKTQLNDREIEKLIPGSQRFRVLKQLIERQAITAEEHLRESYHPKTENLLRLAKPWQDEKKLARLLDDLSRAPAQRSALSAFIRLSGFSGRQQTAGVGRRSLLREQGVSTGALQALQKKGILNTEEVEVSRLGTADRPTEPLSLLSPAQSQALGEIRSHWKELDVVLLNGVTSSGKTELYMHLIAEQLEQGKQVLYLLPEIALTSQIISRLRKVFGNQVGIYHSRFSDAERVETYRSVMQPDGFRIILGVRSSIFLPFSDLGLVIVDEEHENTYKQFDPAPRYQARDAAIYLARMHGARTLLGTATPSLESWANARGGKYGLVELKERYTEILLPEIIVVDTREAYRKKQMKSHFSSTLLKEIGNCLDRKEQVILFQNRRGFSPYLECQSCGHVPHCRDCDVSLTYHQKIARLICHYCGYSEKVTGTCSECGQPDLRTRGFGTEKVEDEIGYFFPDARVARLDLDSTRSRRSYERILGDFASGSIDILVGTQMISKGLDFDHVRLVGILHADNMLNFPDFRAFERSFQLMAQVSGRAGRKGTRGRVILQASDIRHPVISDLLKNDMDHFYQVQLEERQQFGYPPFTRLIRFVLKHRDRETVRRAALAFAGRLRNTHGSRVSGPEAPVIGRVQSFFLQQVLLKLEKDASQSRAREEAEKWMESLTTDPAYRGLLIQPDVDPF